MKVEQFILLIAILVCFTACQKQTVYNESETINFTPTASHSGPLQDSDTELSYPIQSYPANPSYTVPPLNSQDSYPVNETILENDYWEVNVLPPQSGLATMTGLVKHQDSSKPIVNVPISLAEVIYEGGVGAFVLDGAFSPHTVSDSQGRFAFVDIAPGEYVLVVGNPEVTDYQIIENEQRKARIWQLLPDEVLDTSTLLVEINFGN